MERRSIDEVEDSHVTGLGGHHAVGSIRGRDEHKSSMTNNQHSFEKWL